MHYKSEIDYHLYSLDRILLIYVIVKMHIHAIFEQIIRTSRQNKVNSLRKWIRDRTTITHECEIIERKWIHAIFMSLISLSSINLQKKKIVTSRFDQKSLFWEYDTKTFPYWTKKKAWMTINITGLKMLVYKHSNLLKVNDNRFLWKIDLISSTSCHRHLYSKKRAF